MMNNIHLHNKKTAFPEFKQTRKNLVFKQLSLSLGPKEFTCIVGPSGCGKTTLLNVIAGIDNNYDGEIKIEYSRTQQSPWIGYVRKDSPRLLPWLNVRENVGLRLDLVPNQDDFDRLLDTFRLTSVQYVYPKQLSLELKKRVALARAFAMKPDLLLMDEPFEFLDATAAQSVRRDLLEAWYKFPYTTLMVTSNPMEATTLADRVYYLMPPGKLVEHVAPLPIDKTRT